jgi:hypothetical protein
MKHSKTYDGWATEKRQSMVASRERAAGGGKMTKMKEWFGRAGTKANLRMTRRWKDGGQISGTYANYAAGVDDNLQASRDRAAGGGGGTKAKEWFKRKWMHTKRGLTANWDRDSETKSKEHLETAKGLISLKGKERHDALNSLGVFKKDKSNRSALQRMAHAHTGKKWNQLSQDEQAHIVSTVLQTRDVDDAEQTLKAKRESSNASH